MTEPPEDDWFPEADAGVPGDTLGPIEDEWLVEVPDRPAPLDLWALANPRVLVPAGIVITFVVALLAAFGVFSSSSPQVAPPIVTTQTPTAPATQTSTTATTTTSIVPPTMTLKPGDIGPEVKALQQELKTLGYSVGAIDGYYGTTTTQAVTAFQTAHGLTADGIVGAKTLLALAP